jgi:hypothetical protein
MRELIALLMKKCKPDKRKWGGGWGGETQDKKLHIL